MDHKNDLFPYSMDKPIPEDPWELYIHLLIYHKHQLQYTNLPIKMMGFLKFREPSSSGFPRVFFMAYGNLYGGCRYRLTAHLANGTLK